MKAIHILPLVLITVSGAFAEPFSIRQLPAGFDAPIRGGSGGPRIMNPIAADFLGNGRLQWYQGGNVISRFPEGGTLTLPAITLPQTPSATVVPLTAVAFDVDRDGDTDLVRINEWNGNMFEYTLQIFLNNGSGIFTAGNRVDWTNSLPYNEGGHYLTMVPADYDKDGRTDLAILETYSSVNTSTDPDHLDGKLYIRWNNGVNDFSSTTTLQANGLTSNCRITAADYDRDGDADIHCSEYTTYGPDKIIFASDQYDRSLLFTNDGTGAFTVGSNFPDLMPRQFVDLNGDGWTDLADVNRKALNNGAGTFGTPGNLTAQPGAWNGSYLSIFADAFGDPLPELLWVQGGAIKKNYNHDGAISYAPDTVATLPADVDGIGAADSDGDGDPDIFVSMNNGTFAFLENRQLHTVPGATLAASLTLAGITSLHSGDFDLDGHDDLLAVTPSQEKLWFLYTQDNGLPGTPSFKLTQSESPHSAAVADFDRDDRPDVAYTLPATGAVRLVRNIAGSVPFTWSDTAIATGLPGVSLLACGDIGTPTGRPDLYTCSGTTGQIRGLNQSSGSWSVLNILNPITPVPQALAGGQGTISPGDEVAVLSAGASSLSLHGAQVTIGWSEIGGGGRTEAVTGGPHAAKLIWADATGDAREEAIYINGSGGLSAWIPSITASISLGSAPAAIRDIAAVDWDRDGRTDILAATATGLSLYHYQRAGQQWTRTDLHSPATGGYTSVAVLDLNHDGYPDAAAANSSGRLDYLRNFQYGMRADLSALPAQVVLTAGTTGTPVVLPLTTAGRPSESGGLVDVSAAVNRCQLKFQQAVSGPGGTWTPGAPLTASTLSGLVAGVSLVADGFPVGSNSANDLLTDGSLALDYNDAGGVVAPVAPGATVEHSVRLNIPPGALQQPATRFFLTVQSLHSNEINGTALYPGSGDPTLLIGNHPVLITITPALTPLQQWRQTNFGNWQSTGNAANNADPDGDGVANIMEYLTSQNPNAIGGIGAGPVVAVSRDPGSGAMVADLRLISSYDSKVKLTLQYSFNPAASWSLLSTRTGSTGAWTGIIPTFKLLNGGGRTWWTFDGGFAPAIFRKAFFRLKAEELP